MALILSRDNRPYIHHHAASTISAKLELLTLRLRFISLNASTGFDVATLIAQKQCADVPFFHQFSKSVFIVYFLLSTNTFMLISCLKGHYKYHIQRKM